MAALLVTLAVMSVLMLVAMPPWRHVMQREREAELIFRGEQYARAIGLFQRKFAGGFPPSIDVLVQQKFLRKKYKDPMVPDGEFQVLYQTSTAAQPGMPGAQPPGTPPGGALPGGGPSGIGSPSTQPGSFSTTPGTVGGGPSTATGTVGAAGGITGVISKSKKASIRVYKGRSRYNEWQFVYTDVQKQIAPVPGAEGGTGPPGAQGPGKPPGPGRFPTSPGMSPGNPGGFPGGVSPGGVPAPGSGTGRPPSMQPGRR
jgi:type II secretory pathway pseudopilin PulG